MEHKIVLLTLKTYREPCAPIYIQSRALSWRTSSRSEKFSAFIRAVRFLSFSWLKFTNIRSITNAHTSSMKKKKKKKKKKEKEGEEEEEEKNKKKKKTK